MKEMLKRWMTAERLAWPSIFIASVYVIFGGATRNLAENLITRNISGPTPWLVAAILLVMSFIVFLWRRIELRIDDLHRRQRLSVEYYPGGSGASGQAVYAAAAGIIEKATGPDCRIMAVNSFVEVFADSTDEAAEADRSSYLRSIEAKLGQVHYHRIIQLNARDRDALSRIRIGDVISKNYGEHYRKVVEFVQPTRSIAGRGADVTTLLEAVPARYPMSFVLITTPDGSYLIWQMNEHVPHSQESNGHLTDDDKVRLAGVFIISDPDEEITTHFERWFNELANSVERTTVKLEQLQKSERGFQGNDMIVRELFAAIDAEGWERLPDFFSPAIAYSRPGFPTICGISGIDHFYREVRQVRKGVHTIDEIVTERDGLACRGSFAGEMTNGDKIKADFADFCRFENGRIIERRTYFFAPVRGLRTLAGSAVVSG
jgi:uncharacterized protein